MKKLHNIPYKRKRKGKTNYKKRLKMLMSERPRLVIRKSLNNILLQVVNYDPKGDRIIISASSVRLKKLGWELGTGNVPAAYLTGYFLGLSASKKGIKDMILDIGLQKPGQRIYAALRGAVEGGLNIPHSDKILPPDKMIEGQHISEYYAKGDTKLFSSYRKKNIDPSKIVEIVGKIKDKIKGAEFK